jgi:hypothetical protein
MRKYEPLTRVPTDFAINWGAALTPAQPPSAFRLVAIRRTQPKTWEEGRIVVLVVDENGFPLPGVKVAFSYSTAHRYAIDDQFTWSPPQPWRAHIVPAEGSGQIEQVQGSVVKEGQPGGVTVYVVEPEYASDIVSGMGALSDHTGVHLTFQLRREGVRSLQEQVDELSARVAALEGAA